jgi:hypothetical protein
MKAPKNRIDVKRRKMCQKIIGKAVTSAFVNNHLPPGVALAWTGKTDAYLVNLRLKTAREYVKNGKFLMRRLMIPVRIVNGEING